MQIESYFSFYFLFRVFTVLLLLGVFITHSGELVRFLHRLGFLYLLLYIWYDFSGVFIRYEVSQTLSLLEIRQEDSILYRLFFIYITSVVAIFFFGIAERFFLLKVGVLEYALLIFFCYFGGLFILRLHTLRDLLLALERVTLASYVLVTFERNNRFSTYAGVQYFILGSLPSARIILAFGIFYLQGGSLAIQDLDLLFGHVNTVESVFAPQSAITSLFVEYSDFTFTESFQKWWTESKANLVSFDDLVQFSYINATVYDLENLLNGVQPFTSLSIRALFFLLFNLLFKLTAAPFHVWAPSVYGKAPIATVTFLSIFSKTRVLFFLFKLFNTFLHSFSYIIFVFIRFCGIISIFFGRLGAFVEKYIKRFFVFSSRGHVGFRLAGLSLFTLQGTTATFNYLLIYIISSFIRWFFLLTRGRNNTYLVHFSNLKLNDPVLALLFAFLIFSRSGIPPFGGFFIKLDRLAAILDKSYFFINYVLFFFTVASFFYYLRVIKIIFFDKKQVDVNTNIININSTFSQELFRYEGRVWLRIFLREILLFYIVIFQSSYFYVLNSFFTI